MQEDEDLTGEAVFMVGAIEAIIGMLARKGIATHAEFAVLFENQAKLAVEKKEGTAAGLYLHLARHCRTCEVAHRLHSAPPGGSA